MTRGIFPNTDGGLLAWSANFSDLISADPAAYGLSASQAADYQAGHGAFAAALAAADPAIRSMTTTAVKNETRDSLKNAGRLLANLVYGTAGVTDAQKFTLGLTVRKAKTRAIAAPTEAPALGVVMASAWTVKIKLRRLGATAGKPAGVTGASLFSYVGATPPTDLAAWKFEMNTGRNGVELQFPSALPPGTRVWLIAFWFNARHQSGPVCPPVSANLPGGGVTLAA